jgi:hypothetical protein
VHAVPVFPGAARIQLVVPGPGPDNVPDATLALRCVSERVAGGYRAVWLVPELPEAAGEEVPLDGVLGEE